MISGSDTPSSLLRSGGWQVDTDIAQITCPDWTSQDVPRVLL